MSTMMVRLLFFVAALYDGVIGVVFLGWGPQLFEEAGVPFPNHWGYIEFGALLLVIFGVMFLTVAAAPRSNRNLIPFGVLLKLSYTGLVGYYWVTTDLPLLFKPFAIVDGIMLILFIMAYQSLGRARAA